MDSTFSSSIRSKDSNTGSFWAVLACLFVTSLVTARVVSEKYFLFLGQPVSCSTIIYPLTFTVMHIAIELYGPQQGQILIRHGLSISVLVNILLWTAQVLPIAADSPVSKTAFENVLGASLNTTIISWGVYLAGQLFNQYLFVGFQSWSGNRLLWLRSIIASLCVQMLDTVLLTTISYTLGASLEIQVPLLSSAVSQYALKALVTSLSIPFMYLSIALGHQQVSNPKH